MSNRRKPAAEKVRVVAAAVDRVVIAYIHPGTVAADFTQSLMNLSMFDQATGRRIVGCMNEWSSANVSTSRNSLTGRFLDEYDAEWLLWIDADMSFPHDSLDRLLASADKDERPIIGGLCFGANRGRQFPTIYQFVRTEDGAVTTLRVDDYPLDALVQCAATGAAFLFIHRTVLERMRDHRFNAAFPWFQETELAGQPAGEDITFCIRAGILGFPIHVDTGLIIDHQKSTVLNHYSFQAQRATRLQEEASSGDPLVG